MGMMFLSFLVISTSERKFMPVSRLRPGNVLVISWPIISSALKPVIFSAAGLIEMIFFWLMTVIIPEGISSKIFLYSTASWSYFSVVVMSAFSVRRNFSESRALNMAAMKKVRPWIENKFKTERKSLTGLYQKSSKKTG